MARLLIVERDTSELRVVLQQGCRLATAKSVTLTIIREGHTYRESQLPCVVPCSLACLSILMLECPLAKVYSANRVEPGLAIFALDQDLTEAPEGWYRAMIEVDGRWAAVIPLLVQSSGVTVSSCRMTCIGLPPAE